MLHFILSGERMKKLILILTIFLLGCDNNPVSLDLSKSLNSDLFGKWQRGSGYYYKFNSDGTFIKNEIYKGTWITDYDRIILITDDREQTGFYQIQGDRLYLTMVEVLSSNIWITTILDRVE